jgi:hypothetical protein
MINGLRLLSGEDVLGEISYSLDEHQIKLKSPMQVHVFPVGDGRFGIGLMPFLPYSSSKELTVSGDKIILEFDPTPELVAEYTKQVSGLIVPAKSSIELVR